MARGAKIDGLIRWVERDQWQEPFGEVIEQHLGDACAEAGISIAGIIDILGEGQFRSLWGCAFEDFLGRRLEDGRNVTDDYLKRRGWKESARTRAYMAALRDSVPSLYEVSDIVRGHGFSVRDLIRGGEPVAVEEHSGSRNIQDWDRIATRLVLVKGEPTFTGLLLRYRHETTAKLLEILDKLEERALKEIAEMGRELGVEGIEALAHEVGHQDEVLRSAGFVFTHFWLADALDHVLNPKLPEIVNAEGEPFELVTATWPLVKGCRLAGVREALDAAPMLEQADDDVWNWIDAEPVQRPSKPTKGLQLQTTDSQGVSLLGTVELDGRMVTLLVNSAGHMERGRALVEGLLAGKLGESTIERQSVAQLMQQGESSRPAPQPVRLPPEEERQIIHEAMTRHYRQAIDEPVGILGNCSPRDLVTTPEGRNKVVEWLKSLENQSCPEQLADYDFTWLWAELGLTDRRR